MPMTRVMVVEDDVNTLSGYLEFLAAAGFEPRGVSNGAEALSAGARESAGRGRDRHRPARAERLRADRGPPPGCADPRPAGHRLTGQWDVDVKAKAKACGMRAVLVKPCMPAHLVGELNRLMR